MLSQLRRLDFLVAPQGGCVLQWFNSPIHHSADLQKAMLLFLQKLFTLPDSPYRASKVYYDAYISFHWRTFVKLYNSDRFDQASLDICCLHLRILLAFASTTLEKDTKENKIAHKFYQLRTMDFLVREISLEYEVEFGRGKAFRIVGLTQQPSLGSSSNDSIPPVSYTHLTLPTTERV